MADGYRLALAKCFAEGVHALGQYFTLFVELLMLVLVDVSSIQSQEQAANDLESRPNSNT
jgi:hypothetical protein